MITSTELPSRRAVRMPFRILAALICLVGSAAVLGKAYIAWKSGAQALRVQDVVMLPGMAWFMRLAFYAAVRGAVPTQEYWPFASQRVAGCYWLIVLGCSVALR
jgi:hypothetical protein